MRTLATRQPVKAPFIEPVPAAQAVTSLRFDAAIAAASAWLIGGLYLDGWAHHRFASLETFFTPWHAVLYSGFVALVAMLISVLLRHRKRTAAGLVAAVPAGYGLSLLGIGLFFVGGVGDMLWHILFGIEAGIEALLSPTHLVLALGGMLMVTGPLRATRFRLADRPLPSLKVLAPAVIAMALTLALVTFFTEYANPFFTPLAGIARQTQPPSDGQALGITSIIVQTTILMTGILLLIRRWIIPAGSITLLLAIVITLGGVPHHEFRFIPGGVLTGLVADSLLVYLRPSVDRPAALRVFTFVVPALLYTSYFLTLAATEGIGWSVHLWMGAIVIAGIVGVLLSYLIADQPDWSSHPAHPERPR